MSHEYLSERMSKITRRSLIVLGFAVFWVASAWLGLKVLIWALRLAGADI